ncbi:acyltransferase family protein [Actinoplanes auranticolor]|uniref:Acyltransferase n=1 Tax=Actinoplanes auranticolor TaxID=47988 RepID=A0A919VSN2_9ACTN|nr:acyltransferase [Actinoplanes auranticolor]GIM74382.1 acyltransferase [Actinoplanes auranticolor]
MTAVPTTATDGRGAPAGGPGERLPSLTGMRVLAGFGVFSTHIIALGLFADPMAMMSYIHYAANSGVFGVGFFFVLTGFVVTWTAATGDTAGKFWRRRFFKLIPNHIVVYLIILALWLPTEVPINTLAAIAGFFLVTAWSPSQDVLFGNLNGPMWSANIDVLAYAIFPLLYFLIKKIRPNRLWAWAVAMVALAALVPLVAHNFLPGGPPSLTAPDISWPQHWFGFYFPLTRAIEFVLGILMARILLTGRWIGITALPAALLTAGVYLATLDVPIFHGYTVIPLVPIAILIPAMAYSDMLGHRTLVNSRFMVWLGDRMYAFFVTHITVLFMAHAALNGENGVVGMYTQKQFGTGTVVLVVAALYVLCVLVAQLLFVTVERPAMRRWSRSRKDRAEARVQRERQQAVLQS